MLILQLFINGFINAGIYSLLAIGYAMIYRSLKFFYIFFGAIYTLSSYILYYLFIKLNISLAISILLTILLIVGISILVDLLIHIPLEKRNISAGGLFIVSLGLYIVTTNIIALIAGNELKILYSNISSTVYLGNIIISKIQLFQFVLGWGVTFILWLLIRKNLLIKAVWSMNESSDLLKVLGFSWKLLRIIAFGISSTLASLASILVSLDIGVDPYVGMHAILIAAIAVIVGGMENYGGWVLGALILGVSQLLSALFVSAQWQDAISFTVLIFILIFKPNGIITSYKRREEL